MKTIKRTTIKIRQRELIVSRPGEQNEPAPGHICPLCRLPLAGRDTLIEEAKRAAPLAALNENETK